jgi:hypothetical protein
MATTVNNKRTFAKDIATISTALDGIVEFQSIEFSQILITEHGQSINDLQYVKKIRGIYFYTSRSKVENIVCALWRNETLPTYVVCADSKNVYELK